MNKCNTKCKILSPVGDKKMLLAALENGADAVYFGVRGLNMRHSAKNFAPEELGEVVEICHKYEAEAFLTLNTIIYEEELESIKEILREAKKAQIDAVIAWDLAVIKEVQKLNLPIHISTQNSISNSESFAFFAENFDTRCIVLARECRLEQIKKIAAARDKKFPQVQIECFVHGAMCVSVSGRCFLSEFLCGKSANRGQCSQICRRQFYVSDSEKKGQDLIVGPDFIISPKDLCTIDFFDELVKAGINIFKIEGRGRNPEYVALVTRVYKEALQKSLDGKLTPDDKTRYKEELKKVYNRDFSDGFYMGKPLREWSKVYGNASRFRKEFIGKIIRFYPKIKVAELKMLTKEISDASQVFIQSDKVGSISTQVLSLEIDKRSVKKAKKGDIVGVRFETDKKLHVNDEVYVVLESKP